MCINKRHIINKGYRPLDIKTSQFIDVKCNHCIQCNSERQAGYAYRMQLESNLNEGSMNFFVTLTYSPYYRPVLEYFDENMEIQQLSVWNTKHVSDLNKRLRRQIKYYYGITDAFKCLRSCERGTDREYYDNQGHYRIAQKCPHYHLMYNVPNANSLKPIRKLPSQFVEWVFQRNCGFNFRSFFHYLIDTRWKFGNVMDLEVTRDVAACTRYVAQYCTKVINENVFDIPKDKIYRLIDRDFSDRYSDAESKYLARINCPIIPRFKDFRIKRKPLFFFKVGDYSKLCHMHGQVSLSKKFPSPIKFSHLTPRCSQSINLGFRYDPDFLNNIKATLVSGDLVTLNGTNRASLIPLPYYYYKKICKDGCRIPDNHKYFYWDGFREHASYSDVIYRKVQDWNNIDGCFSSHINY